MSGTTFSVSMVSRPISPNLWLLTAARNVGVNSHRWEAKFPTACVYSDQLGWDFANTDSCMRVMPALDHRLIFPVLAGSRFISA
jgi:hypothetical protein